MGKKPKVTNKELQKDVVVLYEQTKSMYQSLLFTFWSYIEWKGDKDGFTKFCENHNKQTEVISNDKGTNEGKDK